MNIEKLTTINDKAFKVASTIKILDPISWPEKAEITFLKYWNQGDAKLPEVSLPTCDYKDQIQSLQKLLNSFTADHPLEEYTKSSIESFCLAAEMVEAMGTPKFQELSLKIYGQPSMFLPGTKFTCFDIASKMLDRANNFFHPHIDEPDLCVSAQSIKVHLEKCIQSCFGDNGPKVEIVDGLAAKATATSKKIKIRNGTCFNVYDGDQLYFHEVATHALTALNGQQQSVLKLMGCGSPRTTTTQEGLASYSEVVTRSISLNRLKRIALRVLGVEKALQGADFLDTFQFFLDNGQNSKESYLSASRIFRGGYPDKNIVFTKDTVYLKGLISVDSLFRWAINNDRVTLLHLLFCGRLSIEDLFLLEEFYSTDLIQAPKYIPRWYKQIEGLAGYLTYSHLSNIIHFSDFENYYLNRCHES